MMKRLNCVVTLIICMLLGAKVNAQSTSSTYASAIDSIQNLINHSSGDELFRHHKELHAVLYKLNAPEDHLRFNQQFIEDAQDQENKKEEYTACAFRIEAMYNYSMPDSLLLAESWKALNKMKGVPEAEIFYYSIASLVLEQLILSGNLVEALKLTKQFHEEAKATGNLSGQATVLLAMGKAYEGLDQYDKAEETYRELTELRGKIEVGVRSDAFKYLIDMLINQDRYDEALEVCKDYEHFIRSLDNHPDKLQGSFENIWFQINLVYAQSYIGLKEYDRVEEYLNRARSYPVASTELGIFSIEILNFFLLLHQEKYQEAEQSLHLMDEVYVNDAGIVTKVAMLEIRADLYHEWGKYEKSSGLYKEYIAEHDSLQRIEMTTNLNALRTQYEVDTFEAQKKQQKQIYRHTVLWFLVALVLLCIIIAVVVVNARKLKVKNRSLLNRIREQDALEQKYEQIRYQQALAQIVESPADDAESKQAELYFKLKELMKDPAVFTNPNINRKTLADTLKTNEKYVFDTIKAYYGTSISDYINNLRLNYARDLLALPSNNQTIDGIAAEVGFSSRSTFYRLFKTCYGMTPVEFRQLSSRK